MTLLGIVIEVRLLQLENAEFPMLERVDPSLNITVSRPVQSLKAEFPILVILLGISTLVMFMTPLKALFGIVVSVFG